MKEETTGGGDFDRFKTEELPALLAGVQRSGERYLTVYEADEDEISILNAAVGPIYDYPSVSWLSHDKDQEMRKALSETLFGKVYGYCVEEGYETIVAAAGMLTEITSIGITLHLVGRKM